MNKKVIIGFLAASIAFSEIVSPLADPKDLFGALRQSAATASHGAAAPGLEGAPG